MCRKHYKRVKAGRDPGQQFSDKPCSVCGKMFTPRSSHAKYCDECAPDARLATIAAYKDAHKEEARQYNAEWHARHPGYSTKKNQEWRGKHPDEYRAYLTQYRIANLEAIRQRFAEWEARNPDHAKIWLSEHRERARLATQRRRAKRHSAETFEVSERDRRRSLQRTNGCCTYCGIKIAGGYVAWDHVVPLVAGGRNSIGNLVPCCLRCNSQKSSYLLSEWRYADLLATPPSKRYYETAA